MKISILICTRNRPEDIVWALPSVLKNIYDDYEVIVVDQSDADDTARIVRPYLESHRNLRYIPTETRGLSPARNLAMSEATGDVIAFTDDDCETGPDWVARIAALYVREPDLDLVFGQVLMPEELKGTDLAVPCLYFDRRRVLRGGEIFGMGANMSFRRSLLARIGGYDDVLGPGAPLACADDFDFSYRAQAAGARVVAEPSIVLTHRAHRDPKQWESVSYLYGIGDASFYAKHARCGDARAAWRLWGRLAGLAAKNGVKGLLRRPTDLPYLRGYWAGIWKSSRFPVSRSRRLYRQADGSEQAWPVSLPTAHAGPRTS